MAEETGKNQGRRGQLAILVVLVAAVGAVALTAFDWRAGMEEPASMAAKRGSGGEAPLSEELFSGQMKNFVVKRDPPALPELEFVDADSRPLSLSDWKGRVVLLNLWATWCAPCRHEMPSLDRLERALGGERFEVVALSVDRKGLEAAGKFLEEVKADGLKLYSDRSGESLQRLKVIGLPATILVDRRGRELGRLLGPAEWDSPEAKALIGAALDGN